MRTLRFHIDMAEIIVQIFEARSPGRALRQHSTPWRALDCKPVTVNREGLPFQARALIARLALARRLALCSRETFGARRPDVLRAAARLSTLTRGLKGAKLVLF